MVLKEWRAVDDWNGFTVVCEFKIGKRRGASTGKISQVEWKSADRYVLLRNLIQSVTRNADEFIRQNT